MQLLARWCDSENICLPNISAESYWRFYRSMRERLADTTVRTRLLAARNYYGYLQSQGVRPDNPTAQILAGRMKRTPSPPYSTDELRRLLSAAQGSLPPFRDVALLTLLVASGGRRGEVVLGLHTDQIDWGQGRLSIMGKGGRPRNLQPGPTAMALLRAYVGDRQGPVWLTKDGRPLSRSGAWSLMKRLAQRAGVEHATLHRFRRTFSHLWLSRNGNYNALRTALGHSDWGMVQLYVAWEEDQAALDIQAQLDLGATA